jgi:hypothetical protein
MKTFLLKTSLSPVQRILQAHGRLAKGSEIHILNNPSPREFPALPERQN